MVNQSVTSCKGYVVPQVGIELLWRLISHQIYTIQGWADIIADVFPDLTKEDLALWKDAGVTFKMRRRYQKFVLLYFVPRSVSDKFQKIYLYLSASFVWYLLGGHS